MKITNVLPKTTLKPPHNADHACTHWQMQHGSTETYNCMKHYSKCHLWRTDRNGVVLYGPATAKDLIANKGTASSEGDQEHSLPKRQDAWMYFNLKLFLCHSCKCLQQLLPPLHNISQSGPLECTFPHSYFFWNAAAFSRHLGYLLWGHIHRSYCCTLRTYVNTQVIESWLYL